MQAVNHLLRIALLPGQSQTTGNHTGSDNSEPAAQQPAAQAKLLFRRPGFTRTVSFRAGRFPGFISFIGFTDQASHAAFSTIQLTSSTKSVPASMAISGTSDVGVMPGWVFNSRMNNVPVSASYRKSDRLTPRHPSD